MDNQIDKIAQFIAITSIPFFIILPLISALLAKISPKLKYPYLGVYQALFFIIGITYFFLSLGCINRTIKYSEHFIGKIDSIRYILVLIISVSYIISLKIVNNGASKLQIDQMKKEG